MSGKKMDDGQWSVNANSSNFTIDLSDYVDGIYLLKISADEGQNTYRILKQ